MRRLLAIKLIVVLLAPWIASLSGAAAPVVPCPMHRSGEAASHARANGIGSAHIIELEPFLDAAYKRNAVELVGFAIVSSTFHRRAGEEAERNLTFDFSALYRIQSRLEGLIEVTTARALIGPESGSQQTFVAPGFKVYPFTNRKLMFGASVELGTGVVHDTHALLLSGFYHF